jgi:hypothetical protein
MMERLLAKMDAKQAKTDANTAEIREMNANMKSMQERTGDCEALKEMTARMDANQVELKIAIARMEWEEPTSVDIEPEAAQRQVPKEDATVKPVGEPKKRRRDRNLDARRRRKQQERTQNKDVSRGIRLQPAEGRPIVQQWHHAEEFYSRRRPGNIVDL